MKRLYRLSQEERNAVRDQIAVELSHEPDVLFAFVYGSFLKSEAFHNVDIGVYLSSSHFNNAMAANLSAHLSGKIKLPVDVRTLNTAPISFCLYVLRGECLFSRDDTLRTDIMEDTTGAIYTTPHYVATLPRKPSEMANLTTRGTPQERKPTTDIWRYDYRIYRCSRRYAAGGRIRTPAIVQP